MPFPARGVAIRGAEGTTILQSFGLSANLQYTISASQGSFTEHPVGT